MYDMPNNAERRKIAKKLGLLKQRKSLPFKQRMEEISRSIAAGKEIFRQKTQQMLREIEEQESAILEGRRGEDKKTENPKRAKIIEMMNSQGEKRSYNEIAADIELSIWRNR